ncbi:hypothetical protein KA005_02370 [bacterium]|nr:hypothetical protein [bacterium]
MKRKIAMCGFMALVAVVFLGGCAPNSFVRSSPGWKVIELRDDLKGDYAKTWQITVDSIARNWDIEIMDKDSGYLRTAWAYGISGGAYNRYRGRLTIKYPNGPTSDKLELKTDAQWAENVYYGWWINGYDTNFNRDVYGTLSGRLGRTVPNR